MFVQLALDYFFSGLDNERGAIGIEQSEIMIRLSGGPFDQPKGPNERAGKTIPADWKIEHGALRGSAVKRRRRDGHLAHRVLFHPGDLLPHARRCAENRLNSRSATRRAIPSDF